MCSGSAQRELSPTLESHPKVTRECASPSKGVIAIVAGARKKDIFSATWAFSPNRPKMQWRSLPPPSGMQPGRLDGGCPRILGRTVEAHPLDGGQPIRDLSPHDPLSLPSSQSDLEIGLFCAPGGIILTCHSISA
ncbi:hypothetical protein TNCV_233141 [Trichonephila clavipes]|nr:hypothetical protein TNCV_233141 [Trichonephila clavipes]